MRAPSLLKFVYLRKWFLHRSGTTLIEIVIYFAIIGFFLTAAMTFAIQILMLNSLSTTSYELKSNVDFITQKMTDVLLTAESVDLTSSIFDTDTGVLSLNMNDPIKTPTSIYFFENSIYLEEGSSDPVAMNTSFVKADSLRFHRVVYSKAPDQIIVDGQLSPATGDIAQLQKEYPFHLVVSLRFL